jgi:hypothetical protein
MTAKRLILSAFIILLLAPLTLAQAPAAQTQPPALRPVAQTAAPAAGLPLAAPESVGMSGPRLGRLTP